jgi:hypothetical protein
MMDDQQAAEIRSEIGASFASLEARQADINDLNLCSECMGGVCNGHHDDLYDPGDEHPDPEDLEPDVWSIWECRTLADGSVRCLYTTNDDEDRGIPGPTVSATYTVKDRERALTLTGGGSRVGFMGHRVRVRFDGEQI